MRQLTRFRFAAIRVCIVLCAGGLMLNAQSGGSIAGTVLDQAGKAIQGASITVKNDAGASAATAATDNAGHFDVSSHTPTNYTVETSAPGFALNTRRSVPVTANAPQELSITLFVDAISQSVTVHESVSIAEEQSPGG